MKRPVKQLTEELKEEILKANESLSGTLHGRSTALVKKFGFSRITISNVIRHTVTVKRITIPFYPGEKNDILKAYEDSKGENKTQKIVEVAEKFKRSTDAIRRILRNNTPDNGKEKMFDYKQPFI